MTTNILTKINAEEAFLQRKSKRDYVFPSFPRGKLGILSSAGGTGKSFYALQASFQVAAGACCNFDLAGVDVSNTPARVLYFSLEDGKEEIKNRLNDIYSFYDDDKKEFLRDLSEFVDIYPISSQNLPLISLQNQLTKSYSEIYSIAMRKEYRLIIIDTLRRSHDCEENNNGVMSQVLRCFEKLAEKSKASVLLLHHENKFSFADADSGSSSVRGASSIVDNARYVMRLQTMTAQEAKSRQVSDDDRRFWIRASLEKTNYGPPQPAAWMKRCKGGVLISAEPPAASNSNKSSISSINQRKRRA